MCCYPLFILSIGIQGNSTECQIKCNPKDVLEMMRAVRACLLQMRYHVGGRLIRACVSGAVGIMVGLQGDYHVGPFPASPAEGAALASPVDIDDDGVPSSAGEPISGLDDTQPLGDDLQELLGDWPDLSKGKELLRRFTKDLHGRIPVGDMPRIIENSRSLILLLADEDSEVTTGCGCSGTAIYSKGLYYKQSM